MGGNQNPLAYTGRVIGNTKQRGDAQFNSTNFSVNEEGIVTLSAATTSTTGGLEISTDAEAQGKSGSTAIVASNLAAAGFLQWEDVSLTSAQIKALATTPITLVAAPAAGNTILFLGAMLKLAYGGSNAFTEAGDNLGIKYTDASDVQVCTTIECTGFIDATVDTYTNAVPKADNIVAATGAEARPLVLDNLGSNFAGNAANDNTFEVRVYYVVQAI